MKYLIFIIVISFLLLPMFVQAQMTATERLLGFIDRLQSFLFTVGSAIAIIVVIVGGVTYMTAGADETKVSNAKKIIMYGLIGLVVVLCSTFIIELLEEVISPLTAG